MKYPEAGNVFEWRRRFKLKRNLDMKQWTQDIIPHERQHFLPLNSTWWQNRKSR